MINLHPNYRRIAGGILQYVAHVIDIVMKYNKQVIVYAADKSGQYIRHLVEDYDGRIKIHCYIDNKIVNLDTKIPIYRQSYFDYIDNDKYIVLSGVRDIDFIVSSLKEYGYTLDKNLFDVRGNIGNSYVEYLERCNNSVDFSSVYNNHGECNEYTPFNHAGIDKVMTYMYQVHPQGRFFDFGMGKGSALLVAYMHGFEKLGGVEYDKNIYNQARINMDALGIPCDIMCADAKDCSIDGYDIIYIYNSFNGELFRNVIDNIEKSFRNSPRKMFIVYANPFEHKAVMKNGVFRIFKQLRVDLYDPVLNIYIAEPGDCK